MSHTLVSFYTDDWEYPSHAVRLASECEKYGIEYKIEERVSTRDYIKNTAMKPFYIKECLEKLKSPIIWVDVDAMIMQPINIDIGEYDILACKHSNTHINREWAVAFLVFNYTEDTLNFVDNWCINAKNGTEENAFQTTWDSLQSTINIGTLPPTYHFVKWRNNLAIPSDTVICHQLSKFEDKLRRKKNGAVDENIK